MRQSGIRNEREIIWARWRLVCIAALAGIAVAMLLSACSVRNSTVTPPPIVSTQASFDGNTQNSGDVSYDADGAIKSGHWLERYDAMLATYGKRFTPEVKPGDRNGIAMVSQDQYRVTAQVSVRFTRMNQWRKADQAP